MAAFYLTRTGAPGDEIPLPKEEAQHALKVLRLSEGDEIDALDGAGGRFRAVVVSAHSGECVVRLTESLPSNEPPVRLTLYQGLPKADKLEFIVQKLTELGAAAVVPVKMERSVVRTDAKDGEKRRERLSKIAHEAAKQCRRARGPEHRPRRRPRGRHDGGGNRRAEGNRRAARHAGPAHPARGDRRRGRRRRDHGPVGRFIKRRNDAPAGAPNCAPPSA